MRWLTRWSTRAREVDDLSNEIRQHLEQKTGELMESGMARGEAEAAARRHFGNVALIEERAKVEIEATAVVPDESA